MSLSQAAYNDAIAYGRFSAKTGSIFGTIIGVIVIVAGIYLYFAKPDYNVHPEMKQHRRNGMYLIGIGLLVILVSYLSYYSAMNYNSVALMDGVTSMYSMAG